MKESYLFDMSFNNLVFLDRNKAYGAYELRKNYKRNIIVAALAGTVFFIGLVATPIIESMFSEKQAVTAFVPEDVPGTVVPILPPPEPVKPKLKEQLPAQPKQEKVAKQKYVEPKVVPNNVETPEDVPNQDLFKTAEISNVTQEGIIPENPTVSTEADVPAGLGTGSETVTEPYIVVEQMPQFGSGEADLIKYLSKNIRYPSRARNAGIEGLVVVTFVVTQTGDVQDIQVAKGLGYGTEEEAIRVVKAMPKWKPGVQNGRAVPVRYTLPIRLQLEN